MSDAVHNQVHFSPDKLDRDRMFPNEPKPEHLWCLHCDRAYRRGKFRSRGSLQMCPYPDCDGDSVIDAWDWKQIRKANGGYPPEPEEGVHYPLYPRVRARPKRK